jgi:2-polyprenyl-3-methyl-5-hydroxy-6-metoxy-1,4-benzoquinol methylase
MSVLEIGFAPGKTLAFVAKVLRAKVSGLDYSEGGVQFSRRLFGVLGIEGDLRCENVFTTTFPLGTFDFVYSVGVIEHFDDPTEIVRRHVELLRPGGTALILIPNYGGFYGQVQRYFDPENLKIHNLEIMTCDALVKLSPSNMVENATSFRTGKVSPWLISFDRRWPRPVATLARIILNSVGLLQPVDITMLCPMLALKMERKR